MTIRPTTPVDIPQVLALYKSAQKALLVAGIDQWQDGYPNHETLIADMRLATSYTCYKGSTLVATAAICVGTDPTYQKIYEGAWQTPATTYGVLHRVAVDPHYKGQGIAPALMDFAATLAQNAGATSLRCDTHQDNQSMRHCLEKAGFAYCGVILLQNGNRRVAYERLN